MRYGLDYSLFSYLHPWIDYYASQVIDFGSYSPCEQIMIAKSAAVFFFVHGAEGRMISFLDSSAIAVEIYPAGLIKCVY